MNGTEGEVKKSSIMGKISLNCVLLSIRELGGNATNKSISEYTGYSPQMTSIILRELDDFKLIERTYLRDDPNKPKKADGREGVVSLTKLGKAQACLVKLSVNLMPGRDEIAEQVIKLFDIVRISLRGKKDGQED